MAASQIVRGPWRGASVTMFTDDDYDDRQIVATTMELMSSGPSIGLC
jgi:hypothetical protein